MEYSSPERFIELVICRNMLLDHMPSKYDKGFDRVYDGLMRSRRKSLGQESAISSDVPETTIKFEPNYSIPIGATTSDSPLPLKDDEDFSEEDEFQFV